MANFDKVRVNNVDYDIADSYARSQIETLQNSLTGGMHYIGSAIKFDEANVRAYIKTGNTTAICYYTGTKPTDTTIVIGSVTYTLTYKTLTAGDLVIYDKLEYIFSDADSKFHEFGSTSSLKALAFKDSASGSFTPKGTIANNVTKTNKTLTHSVTQGTVSANGTFTPSGNVTIETNVTGTFVKSYPGVKSKLKTTTVHDTPTQTKATITKDNLSYVKAVNTGKLVTTTINGVSGSTQASKANVDTFAGVDASVSGTTLVLTSKSVSFSDITVPIATTAKTVATGGVSAQGTGSTIATGGTTGIQSVVTKVGDSSGNDVTQVVSNIAAGTAVTVATGGIAANGGGDSVMTDLGTASTGAAITSIGELTFEGKSDIVSVSGTTSGVAVGNHSIATVDNVTSVFTGTKETITVS